MTDRQLDWRNDWQSFVQTVMSDYDCGLSDSEVTERFGEQRVQWVGTVADKELESERPRVVLNMAPVQFDLIDGRRATVDYLNLNLDDVPIESWRRIPDGKLVRFRTSIWHRNGPFPGLRLSNVAPTKCVLLIGTRQSEFVEFV